MNTVRSSKMIWLAQDRHSLKWFVMLRPEKETARDWIAKTHGPYRKIYTARARAASLNH
jgi:hypothetical protein